MPAATVVALYFYSDVCARAGKEVISPLEPHPSGSCRALTGLPPRGSRRFSSRAAHAPKTFLHRRGQRELTDVSAVSAETDRLWPARDGVMRDVSVFGAAFACDVMTKIRFLLL